MSTPAALWIKFVCLHLKVPEPTALFGPTKKKKHAGTSQPAVDRTCPRDSQPRNKAIKAWPTTSTPASSTSPSPTLKRAIRRKRPLGAQTVQHAIAQARQRANFKPCKPRTGPRWRTARQALFSFSLPTPNFPTSLPGRDDFYVLTGANRYGNRLTCLLAGARSPSRRHRNYCTLWRSCTFTGDTKRLSLL